jgi:hypothetical protein
MPHTGSVAVRLTPAHQLILCERRHCGAARHGACGRCRPHRCLIRQDASRLRSCLGRGAERSAATQPSRSWRPVRYRDNVRVAGSWHQCKQRFKEHQERMQLAKLKSRCFSPARRDDPLVNRLIAARPSDALVQISMK